MHFSSIMSLLGMKWFCLTKQLIKILAVVWAFFHSKTCRRQGSGASVLDNLSMQQAYKEIDFP